MREKTIQNNNFVFDEEPIFIHTFLNLAKDRKMRIQVFYYSPENPERNLSVLSMDVDQVERARYDKAVLLFANECGKVLIHATLDKVAQLKHGGDRVYFIEAAGAEVFVRME